MKRSLQFVASFVAIIVFFLLPAVGQVFPHMTTPVFAAVDYTSNGFTEDLDAARGGQMNVGGYLYMINDRQWKNLTCEISPSYGPNGCTNSKQYFPLLLKQSALGNIAMGVDFLYQNPPADLAYWIQDTGTSLGFLPQQVHAQGVGFQGLQPLLPIWKALRNMAYLIIAVALIIVGFMVMVRKRIDPKTVVTVQNSLPRIVIALILITFSYALVGFMIDLMYVIMAFVSIMFRSAYPPNAAAALITLACPGLPTPNLSNPGLMDFIGAIFSPLWTLNPICHGAISITQGNIGQMLLNLLYGAAGAVTGNTLSTLFGAILGLCYLFAFVRLLFMLLGAYIQVLLAVLTGPLQMLLDVFPGGNGFGNWIKNLTANLIVFPITSFMLLLANAVVFHLAGPGLWTAPFLPQTVGAADLTGGLAETLIALGIILIIPNVTKGLKDQFKAQPVASFGVNVGGALNTGMQALSAWYYIKQIKDSGKGSITNAANVQPPHGLEEHE